MDETLRLLIKAEAREAVQELEKVKDAAAGAEKKTDDLSTSMDALGKAIPFAAFVAFGTQMVQMFAEAELSATKLSNAVSIAGGSLGLTTSELTAFSSELQQTTAIGDDLINEVMAQLITTTDVAGEDFKRLTRVSADLSKALGMDMRSAAITLGRALENPATGMQMLARQGIVFSKSQRETIQNMIEMGDVAGAQALILGEVESRVGGMAEVMRDTLSGSLTAAGEAFGDLGEVIGESLAPTVRVIAESLKGIAEILQSVPKPILGATMAFAGLALGIPAVVSAFKALKVSMTAMQTTLMGPVGIIALVGAAAIAWMSYTDEVNRAKEAQSQAIREMNQQAQSGLKQISMIQDLQSAREKVNEIETEGIKLANERKKAQEQLMQVSRKENVWDLAKEYNLEKRDVLEGKLEEAIKKRLAAARLEENANKAQLGPAQRKLQLLEEEKRKLDEATKAQEKKNNTDIKAPKTQENQDLGMEVVENLALQATGYDMLQSQIASYYEEQRLANEAQEAFNQMLAETPDDEKLIALGKAMGYIKDETKEAKDEAKEFLDAIEKWGPAFSAAQGAWNALTTLMDQGGDMRIKRAEEVANAELLALQNQIDAQKQAGKDTSKLEQEKANREMEIEAELAKQKEEFDRQKFERDKAVAIVQAGIAGALEIVKASGNLPLQLAIGALTAAQIGFMSAQQYPGLATGGTIQSSGRVLVGEEGPELLDLPTGASVIPLKNGGGGGITIVVNVGTLVGSDGMSELAVILDRKLGQQRRLGR